MADKVTARIFNIMQYCKHPDTGEVLITENTIITALAHKSIKRYAYILHDKDVYSEKDEEDDSRHKAGTLKPPHFHIVIQCVQTELDTIARWFCIASNYVEIPAGKGAGKFLDCVMYLTHEDYKQIELGKYRYPDEEVKANFDFRTALDKRAENRDKYGIDVISNKQQIRLDVLNGIKSLNDIRREFPIIFTEDIDKLKKLRGAYLETVNPPTTRINYYIYGNGGVGKGLTSRALARALFPDMADKDDCEIFFEIGADNVSFEGYDGQPVIIWNDMRSGDLIKKLKSRGNVFNVFDTHPRKIIQDIKYSSTNLINSVNIVNSVQPYREFLDGLAGEYTDRNGVVHEAEDENQSYRRFPFIIPLREEDFDLLVNKGFYYNTGLFTEYEEYNHIRGNMQKLINLCKGSEKLAQKYANAMLQLPIDKFNTVLADPTEDNLDAFLESYLCGLGKQVVTLDLTRPPKKEYTLEPITDNTDPFYLNEEQQKTLFDYIS